MKRRRWVRPLIIGAIAVAVIACIPVGLGLLFAHPWDTIPSKADVAGVWRDGNSNRYLTLYPSGKITFSNIPKGVIYETGDDDAGKTVPTTVSGRWHAFYREGGYGPVTWYTVPHSGGSDKILYEAGNNVFGRTLSIASYGYQVQVVYNFHRVSTKP